MIAYIGITESQSNPFAPVTAELVKQLRDNPIAIAGGAQGAPRIQTNAIEDSAVTTAKIANGDVTRTKLAVGTRSFSGSLNAGADVLVSYSDNFAFVPRVGNAEVVIRGGAFRVINASSSFQSYSITWRYLTT